MPAGPFYRQSALLKFFKASERFYSCLRGCEGGAGKHRDSGSLGDGNRDGRSGWCRQKA